MLAPEDMDMDSLPLLVLEKIIQYLSNQDLAACCACSISWRETFDQDACWEPRCDRTIASHLRIFECEVEPGFVSPEREDSKLTPISEWRMSFMRETHLWRNWRQKRYVEQEIQVEQWEHICFLTKTDVLVKINVKAKMWDVRKTPRCLGEVFTLNGSNVKCHVFELFDDNKFLVLQDVTLHLYQISSPLVEPWKLIYKFNLATVVDQLSDNLREAHVTGSILVLFLNTGSVFSFDINSKILSRESKVPRAGIINKGYHISDILQSESKSMEFGVLMFSSKYYHSDEDEEGMEYGYYIFIYSARHKNFLDFRKHVFCLDFFYHFQCVLSDNYIATLIINGPQQMAQLMEVTDFNTGEVLVDIEVYYKRFTFMKGIEGICEYFKVSADCPPISMIMNDDIDSSFRIALSRSLGIKTYTRRMFLQHVCKHLNTQGNVNVYVLDTSFTNLSKNKKCNQVYTCVIDNGVSWCDLRFFKFW